MPPMVCSGVDILVPEEFLDGSDFFLNLPLIAVSLHFKLFFAAKTGGGASNVKTGGSENLKPFGIALYPHLKLEVCFRLQDFNNFYRPFSPCQFNCFPFKHLRLFT